MLKMRENMSNALQEEILKLKEEDVATMLNLANMYVSIDDFEKARMLLYKVDYLRPNNYKAMSGLAWCLFVGGDYEKAMTYYDKLLQHKDLLLLPLSLSFLCMFRYQSCSKV